MTTTQPTGTCQDCGVTILISAEVRSKWPAFRPSICSECSSAVRRAHGGFVEVSCGGEVMFGLSRLRPTEENRRAWRAVLAEYTPDDPPHDPDVIRRFMSDPRIKALRRDPSQYEPHSDGPEVTGCSRCGGTLEWRGGEIHHVPDELEARRRVRTTRA